MGLFAVLLLLGTPSGDLADLLDLHDYFQVRKIAVTPAQMLELAGTTPKDARQELRQLLALRYFTEHAADVQKAANIQAILTTVEAIAAGKQAPDLLGFAPEYAAKAAAALGSKKVESKAATPSRDRLRKDALAWFPKDATTVVAIEIGQVDRDSAQCKRLRDLFVKLIPLDARGKLYTELEKIGNVRLERISMAHSADPEAMAQGRFYMRFTGKAETKRLLELYEQYGVKLTVATVKTPEGTVITHVQHDKRLGALAFVGNSDFLLADYEKGNQADRKPFKPLIDTMLAIRAGKTPSVLSGPLNAKIELTSAQAVGILVGALPPELQREFNRGLGIAAPKSVSAELTRQGALTQLNARIALGNAADAKQLAALILVGRDKAKIEVTRGEQQPKLDPLPLNFFKDVHKMLDSVHARAEGDAVQADVRVDLQVITQGALLFLMMRQGEPDRGPGDKSTDPAKDNAKPKTAPPAQPPPGGMTLLDAQPAHRSAPALRSQSERIARV